MPGALRFSFSELAGKRRTVYASVPFLSQTVGLASRANSRIAARLMVAIVGRDQLITSRLIAQITAIVPPVIAVHRARIIALECANGGLELTLSGNRRSGCDVDGPAGRRTDGLLLTPGLLGDRGGR
jgi:hypothetical protein